MPFDVVAANSSYFDGNTCHRQPMCYKTVLNFQFWLRQAFSNSIYRILMEKSDNSGSVLISAVFETREDLD